MFFTYISHNYIHFPDISLLRLYAMLGITNICILTFTLLQIYILKFLSYILKFLSFGAMLLSLSVRASIHGQRLHIYFQVGPNYVNIMLQMKMRSCVQTYFKEDKEVICHFTKYRINKFI